MMVFRPLFRVGIRDMFHSFVHPFGISLYIGVFFSYASFRYFVSSFVFAVIMSLFRDGVLCCRIVFVSSLLWCFVPTFRSVFSMYAVLCSRVCICVCS